MVVGGAFLLAGLAGIALGIFTLIDASKYPEEAFRRTGSSKTTWQVLPIVFAFFCGIGAFIMGLIWFGSKRDAVQAAAGSLGYGYGYGPPYGAPPSAPGWTPPPMPPTATPPPATPPPPPQSPPPATPPSQ